MAPAVRSVVFTTRAAVELSAAVEWYDLRRDGLGRRFLDAVEAVIPRLQHLPSAGQPILAPIRRAFVRKFPFSIFYVESSEAVVILAVFHNRRDPSGWPRPAP